MKRLAIIPAREGSKRIPLKNIKDFCGHPMISYVLKAAKASGIFDTIHVSTDSQKIAEIAGNYCEKPAFMRPDHLSDDHSTIMDVMRHVVGEFKNAGELFDTVSIIYATSPLVDSNDLVKACEQFETGDKSKPLLAVTAYPSPIEWAFRMQDNGTLIPDREGAFSIRSQDLNTAYYDAAMFAFFNPDTILESEGAGSDQKFRGFPVPSYRVTDIDTMEDWVRAEKLFQAMKA